MPRKRRTVDTGELEKAIEEKARKSRNMMLVLKELSRSIKIVLVDINDTSAFRHLLLAILKPTVFAMLVHSHPCSREERTSAAEACYQARVSAKTPGHL